MPYLPKALATDVYTLIAGGGLALLWMAAALAVIITGGGSNEAADVGLAMAIFSQFIGYRSLDHD